MTRHKEASKLPTVIEALSQLTVDDLKRHLALLPTAEKPTRKPELVAEIARHLEGEGLRRLWEQLDGTQRAAVSEVVHSPDGLFRAERFQARYGGQPNWGTSNEWGFNRTPSRLCLFIYRDGLMPAELRERLRAFVPEPAAPKLKVTDELPEVFNLREERFDFEARRREVKVKQIPVTQSAMERNASHDLHTVLRLIERGRLMVSDKTSLPSSATVDEVAALLRGGDYYYVPNQSKKRKYEQEAGPIKAFAWPLLVQAAGLAEQSGKRLALTKAGLKALSSSAADTLRLCWQRWMKTKLLDELRRVEVIKGQTGKGARGLTAAAIRRAVIADALKECPVNQWVKADEFFRYMRAAGFDFEVTRDPWELYIEEQEYGSLGYEGFGKWSILQGRYALCLLFEYAATLGVIDVAYVAPEGARQDFRDLWGADDLEFFSRYDGLLYFRLTTLGAYCLGLTDEYVPTQVTARATISVLPSLKISVTGEALLPEETLLLETYAEKESESSWYLNRAKVMAALENGHQIAELREFLQARDDQPLPETVEGFLREAERNAGRLRDRGPAVLVECADAALAETLAQHEKTKPLCLRAGEKYLVVSAEGEERFRQALHNLGYCLPKV
ncbi:MAG: helicase-associated domain-containing protein [Acidobacteria bacterium]|nr:helicase-associated domain-containing protein [Acidobacteriota bacterium]